MNGFPSQGSCHEEDKDSPPDEFAEPGDAAVGTLIAEQLYSLKTEIVEINDKFNESSQLLRQKEEENRLLREKLMALEMTVQNLFESSRVTGCCSTNCLTF